MLIRCATFNVDRSPPYIWTRPVILQHLRVGSGIYGNRREALSRQGKCSEDRSEKIGVKNAVRRVNIETESRP